ncbi:MAG: undecaprenyl-diphosphate phosphatase [Actinomycetales bacterium]|nr:undecaprenyl-diphosphate phosphatase [Actinomycetales bacterium]
MNLFDAIILGVVQGLTEFLPVSSSAHVALFEQILNVGSLTKPQLTAFIATIQLGTEAAVLLYFFKDILRIGKGWFAGVRSAADRGSDYKMGWLVIIGSLPVVIVGLAFKDLIENDLRSLWFAGFSLIVFGILLGAADSFGKRQLDIDQLSYKHGILFGLGQALAVIPGVSRSGGTISVGLFLGYTRAAAARYSFLLAIPAVLASGLYEFAKTAGDLPGDLMLGTLVGTAVSFGVGYAVIAGLLRYLTKGSFMPFVLYRVILGATILGLLTTGTLQP